jgi:hypothetical protein
MEWDRVHRSLLLALTRASASGSGGSGFHPPAFRRGLDDPRCDLGGLCGLGVAAGW